MKLKDFKTSNLTLEQLKKQSKTKGCVLSVVGSIIYGVLKVFGCKTKDYYGIPYFFIIQTDRGRNLTGNIFHLYLAAVAYRKPALELLFLFDIGARIE